MTSADQHIEPDGQQWIEPDTFDDADSSYQSSLGDASYTTSITSSVMNYTYENGRRYHSYHEGEYVLPNDEREQDRLEISHHIYLLLFNGELHRAPIKNPARVLDIGTGTGLWAIEWADQHPEAEVIGNDLSPIQPSWIPPNCRFEVDDFELIWSYTKPFDYIHGRELEGCVRDHDHVFREAFRNLKPGGYFEMSSFDVNTYSDDGTHLRAVNLLEGIKNIQEASKQFGKDMSTTHTWKQRLEQAGFVNVQEETYKLPQSPWPKDPKRKNLGVYHQANMFEAIPPYLYALLTRVLGWERTEIEALVAGIRAELKDLSLHLYTKVHVVYGQKPE